MLSDAIREILESANLHRIDPDAIEMSVVDLNEMIGWAVVDAYAGSRTSQDRAVARRSARPCGSRQHQ